MRVSGSLLVSGVLVLLCAAGARADSGLSLSPIALLDETRTPSEGSSAPWWLGGQGALQIQAVTFGGTLLVDATKVVRGGVSTRAWPLSYQLDIHATADTERLLHLAGGTAYADFQSHDQSHNGDAAVGDIQGYDTTTAPRFNQIAQLWYKQAYGDVIRVKVGKIDANVDAANAGADAQDAFSLIEHSLDSISAPPTYPATLVTLPTYPEGAPGVEAFFGKEIYAGVGVFYSNRHQTFLNLSGHPEKIFLSAGGVLVIGELGARWKWGELPGHAGAGGWVHTGNFPRVDGTGVSHGSGGGYAFVDQSLLHQEGNGGTRDLGFYINAGIADKATDPMAQSVSAGVVAAGFMPGRPADSVGVMSSWARLSPVPGLAHSFELANQVYYKLQITPWASVKPAFQYINHPGGVHSDAAVAMVRVEVDF